MSVATDNHPSTNGDLINRVQQLRLDGQLGTGTAPRGGGSWLPWVLCGLLSLSWVGVGVRWYRTAAAEKAADGPVVATPTNRPAGGSTGGTGGPTSPVAPGEIVLQLKGNLIPSLQIAVSPIEVAGRLTEVHFKEGDQVKKDQVLAQIDPELYVRELEEAEHGLEAANNRYLADLPGAVRPIEIDQATAELDEAKASRVSAEKEFARQERLRTSGVFAQQDYDKADADVRGTKARVVRLEKALIILTVGPRKERLKSLQWDMKSARARRDKAKWKVANCQMKAPINGTILTKKADIGSLINPLAFSSSNGGSSGSLCEIADLSKLEVEVDVPERQITKVREKLECHVAADADPDRLYRGFVDRVMPIADDSKNVIKIRVRVVLKQGEKPGSFLKPKMSVVVTAYQRDFDWKPDDQKWE